MGKIKYNTVIMQNTYLIGSCHKALVHIFTASGTKSPFKVSFQNNGFQNSTDNNLKSNNVRWCRWGTVPLYSYFSLMLKKKHFPLS